MVYIKASQETISPICIMNMLKYFRDSQSQIYIQSKRKIIYRPKYLFSKYLNTI